MNTPLPITPSQFDSLLSKTPYAPQTHILNMIVAVPAGAQANQPDAHLVVWRNHTAASVRLEIVAGWPVLGVEVRERAGDHLVLGFGLADRQGGRFAQPDQVCSRCGRTFAPLEVVAANGDCADRDQCVEDAGEYKMPLDPSRVNWQVRCGLRQPYDREREERLGQYRVARNLRWAIAGQAFEPQPGVRNAAADTRP